MAEAIADAAMRKKKITSKFIQCNGILKKFF
jgi:hypothetical protein